MGYRTVEFGHPDDRYDVLERLAKAKRKRQKDRLFGKYRRPEGASYSNSGGLKKIDALPEHIEEYDEAWRKLKRNSIISLVAAGILGGAAMYAVKSGFAGEFIKNFNQNNAPAVVQKKDSLDHARYCLMYKDADPKPQNYGDAFPLHDKACSFDGVAPRDIYKKGKVRYFVNGNTVDMDVNEAFPTTLALIMKNSDDKTREKNVSDAITTLEKQIGYLDLSTVNGMMAIMYNQKPPLPESAEKLWTLSPYGK